MSYKKVMKYVIERQGYRNEEDKCEGLRNSKNFFREEMEMNYKKVIEIKVYRN